MATHASDNSTRANDRSDFQGGSKLFGIGAAMGVVGLVAALALGFSGTSVLRPFLFGYLAAYMFVLLLALGSLAFVLLQHLTRAAWSVGVRRTAENFAATLPVLAVFALPILLSVAFLNGGLYRWALPMSRASAQDIAAADKSEAELEEGGAADLEKTTPIVPTTAQQETNQGLAKFAAPSDPAKFTLDPLDLMKRNYGLHWLNPWFFIFRVIVYFACWIGIARWYRRLSVEQDRSGNDTLSLLMQTRAAPCLVLLGLTITGAAFDFVMSLDPHWYSTMFGVVYIANSFVGSYALLIITVYLLQKFGYLQQSITREHFHDLGKYLFGFTFFYGYVFFSQYMLMWYANIPEETEWMVRHGASTDIWNGWNTVILVLLFCHILIPFAGLLSRFPKRRPNLLVFWAVWQFVFVAVDMYWLVMPEIGATGPELINIVINVCAAVGLLGVLIAAYGRLASSAALRPIHDPRLADSLVFENI
ncbi:MAG TPA: hypothetical protein VG326_10400 [Tepidisphaeraceae bacterium]|nr:hypothetical protein [Tepidisphaeraceae bacterium]